ncbi:baseplate J/gp47 family protein [Lusitaniella coriacea LEGE 07157]|uniref:Baseplate J/gp47 family protein n=1 Tax=Lusitaniella coriacea LEGE 07157 TaxID=945747 RepID=A0A8J7DWK6_9CYAN|nr:baseplate J/gp47 family protein [Lusitaniella coriacea]MBE9116397.1 baseplate J/gp47 family protein [Lusitaniella coriacea LEGE 07157]
MEIKAEIFRDGTSQNNRSRKALETDYVAVDERTLADWIRLAQAYAKDLKYFNSRDRAEGDWSSFFAGDAQAIADAVESLDAGNTNVSKDILDRIAQPHFALFLTFLKLLRYPQQQFKALTQRRLDFYYRQVLHLSEKEATRDRVRVIFSLASDRAEYLLEKGTHLSAGTDAKGNDLHYAADRDLYINQAQVASVKTLSVQKVYIDLEAIHLKEEKTNEAFEKVLRWAVGTPNQGDNLPTFPQNDPTGTPMDIAALNTLYKEIADYTLEQVSEDRQQYILNQLCFAALEDFQFCFAVHTREIAKQRGEPDIIPPTDLEWQQVYRLIEKAYRKKINRDRRNRLKQEHRSSQYNDPEAAFLGLWRFALGNPLPPFPESQEVDLDELLTALDGENAEDAARYTQENLFLSVADFQKIMGIQSQNWDAPEWDEVYRLLERAQTRKEAFTYPPIGRTEIKGICANAIASAEPNEPLTLPRFHPFIAQPLDSEAVQSLGVAISSPVLWLKEGNRAIALTLSCQADTFTRGLLKELLAQGEMPFSVAISSAEGWLWIPEEQLGFAVGDFFLEPPLKTYSQTELFPIYQTPDATFEESRDSNQYLRFPDGSMYRIDAVLSATRVRLSAVGYAGGGDGITQYPTLDLGGDSVVLNDLQLSDNQQEFITSRDRFNAEDVGKFVVLADGTIYQIEQFANARRVGVRYWGYLPASGETRKYDRIVFSAGAVAQLSDLTLESLAIAPDVNPPLTPQDIGTLWVGVNGEIAQLVGFLSDREATVTPIGRLEKLPLPDAKIEQYSASGIYLNSLQFKIALADTQPAITPPDARDFQTSHPVIKIALKEGNPEYYPSFKTLCLEKANIQVAVQDIQELQLRNDRAVLNPKSPFEPFDSQPIAGSSFYFAHPEIVSKKLDSLTLNVEWMGLPDDFATHYYAYSHCGLSPRPPELDNSSFKAQLDLFFNRTWHPIAARSLFSTEGRLHYDKAHFINLPSKEFARVPNEPETNDLWEQNRYFRLELTRPDFQHNLYGLVLNKVARAKDNDFVKDANGNDTATAINALTVYPPYTPKIKSITLNYQASAEIRLRTHDGTAGQIFQLHPFGYLNLQNAQEDCYYFLPQYETEGSLFIGIRDLHPPQHLTLLFQLVSGSGNADLINPDIQWSYLARDRWQPFPKTDLLSDSTNGLVDSGILHFTIPANATHQNHLFPSGLYWLRATASHNTASIPDALDIRSQAVTATFINQDNDPDHLSTPLAADSIQSLVERNPAISKVEQPYSSFGGRRQETPRAFYTRVSERLRHKQRAVTRWDYERLVLEEFPQIYKVKCLAQAEQSHAPSAAQVTVVVIPNLANTAPFLPLEPKAPLYLLREIEAYLKAHASPFVKVVVKNPRYEQIKYRLAVRFREGYEQGYSLKQLNEELVRFLSPWAYEEQSDISFGSSIHSSTVIHFIESRPYVDYVANLKLIEQVAISAANPSTVNATDRINTTNLAQVKQVDSILVSAPEHIIDSIASSDYAQEEFEGVDYMIIGLDFAVT